MKNKTVKDLKCSRCKEVKETKYFDVDNRSPYGFMSACKKCISRYQKERYAKKPKEIKNESQKYYYKNRDKVISRTKSYSKTEKGKEVIKGTNKRMREKYPEKYKARELFRRAVQSGLIKRLPCSVCGDLKSQGHHEDYSKPYDVIWLCIKHHFERHRKYNNTSYTCCNIEVSEPKGSEVHCEGCGEWCQTK